MSRSPGNIVFNQSTSARAVVREGLKVQSFEFQDLSQTPRRTVAIPIGDEDERIVVVAVPGNRLPTITIGGVTSSGIGVSAQHSGRIVFSTTQSTIMLFYYRDDAVLTWSVNVIAQTYQVPMIIPVPRTAPSRSGYLIHRYGSASTGGTVTDSVEDGASATIPAQPGSIFTVTSITISGTVNGQNAYIGLMYPMDSPLVVTSASGMSLLQWSIFTPITTVEGAISAPTPDSVIRVFSSNGVIYRPGDSYAGDEMLAFNTSINPSASVRRLVLPVGARTTL